MDTTVKRLRSAAGVLFRTAFILGVLILIPLVALPPALAQEATGEVKKMEPVIVTGSLIPTSELITATPVDTYTAADIAKTGNATTREFLRQLPSSTGNASFGDSRGNGGDGTASAALRDIPGGTLVLINGRRVAANQQAGSGNVDINAIPLAAIDRIEILKSGASAIYGADAVAGVINVILKKNFNGLETYNRYGNTFDNDSGEQTHSFITGTTTERASMMVGASYYNINPMFSRDRDTSTAHVLTNPLDALLGTSGTGNPGRIGQGSLGTDGVGVIYTGAVGTTPSSPADFRDFVAAGAPNDRFNFANFTPSYTQNERWYIFGNGTYDILTEDRLQFFADLSYSHTKFHNEFAPSPLVSGLVGPIPAGNPYNVFGEDITQWRYRTVELGPRTDDITGDIFRAIGGLRGNIANTSWSWETGFLYTEDDRFEEFGGDVSASAVITAANSTDADTAFNPFGNRANTQTVLDLIALTETARTVSTLRSWDAVIRGDLFDVPGGPVKMAVGGGLSQQRVSFQPDEAFQSGDSATGQQSTGFTGSRNFESAFIDVVVPVVGGEFSAPLFHKIEVEAAGRYDNYSDFGDTENPSVAVRYQPLANGSVTVRGSFGNSFQAPDFASLELTFLNFPVVSVPLESPGGFVYTNGGQSDQLENGSLFVANPDLQPQTSQNWSMGIVLTPPQIKGLTLSVDYYNLAISKVLFQDAQFILNTFNPPGTPGNPTGDINPLTGNPFIILDSLGNLVSEEVPTLNLAAINTDGFDFAASYQIPTDNYGTFTLTSQATYVLTWERAPTPGAPAEDFAGDFSDDSGLFGAIPRFKSDYGVTWDYKDYSFTTTAHYISGYNDQTTGGDVRTYFSVDAQLAYLFRKTNTRVAFGIINIANEEPPTAYSAFADFYARDLYDIRQRQYYFFIDQKF